MNEKYDYDEVVTLLLDAKESVREARALADDLGLHADFEGMIDALDIFTLNIQMAVARGSEEDER